MAFLDGQLATTVLKTSWKNDTVKLLRTLLMVCFCCCWINFCNAWELDFPNLNFLLLLSILFSSFLKPRCLNLKLVMIEHNFVIFSYTGNIYKDTFNHKQLAKFNSAMCVHRLFSRGGLNFQGGRGGGQNG
jgi:hypothetical protein